jgi:hypothetical protein
MQMKQGKSQRQIYARAKDIRDPNTQLPQRLLVDTNAWLCTQYSPFSLPGGRPEAKEYTDFIARCLKEGCQLIRSAFSLPEMIHVIEDSELEVHNQRYGKNLRAKQARYETGFRRKTVAEVLAAWDGVKACSEPSPGLTVTNETVLDIVGRFGQYKLDGYDLFILQEARHTQTLAILTHDFDYLSVPDLCVYTSNAQGLAQAKACGRLS